MDDAERKREYRNWLRGINRWRRTLPAGHYNSYVHRVWPLHGTKYHWTRYDRRGKRVALCGGPKSFIAESSNTDPALECKRCRVALVKGDGTYWVLPAKGDVAA